MKRGKGQAAGRWERTPESGVRRSRAKIVD